VLRALMAGISAAVAAIIGVVTSLISAHPSSGLWAALAVAIVLGGSLQAIVTYGDGRGKGKDSVQASGAGAVAIGGSASSVSTHVSGRHNSAGQIGSGHGVSASGPGSVSVGGNASGYISSEISSDEETSTS
jgi:hypothetical protein